MNSEKRFYEGIYRVPVSEGKDSIKPKPNASGYALYIITDKDLESWSEQEAVGLEKMLLALDLNQENAVRQSVSALHSGHLFSESTNHFLILSNSETVLTHMDLQPFTWSIVGKHKFLKAPSFPSILKDNELKKKLWLAMKKEFIQ